MQLHATRCCNSPKTLTLRVHGLHYFTGKGPIETKSKTDQDVLWIPPPHSSAFPCCWTENAFDLKLEAAVFSDDNEYYMETALRCNSASCPLQWCSICQQEPGPQAGLEKNRLSADLHRISTAKSLTSLRDSCCQLIEFCNSSFILVYCQHNRWQADETPPKN